MSEQDSRSGSTPIKLFILGAIFLLTAASPYLFWLDFHEAWKMPKDYNIIVFSLIALPIFPILVHAIDYYVKKLSRNDEKYQSKNPEEDDQKENPFNIIEALKSMTQFLSIILSIIFSFVLFQNIAIMNRDIGSAIHLTSKQFVEYKYEWAALAFILIAIIYLTFIPQYILGSARRFLSGLIDRCLSAFPDSNQTGKTESFLEILHYYILRYILLYSIPLMIILPPIQNAIIILLRLPGTPSTALFILAFASIASTIGNIKIISEELKISSSTTRTYWKNIVLFVFISIITASFLSPIKSAGIISTGGVSIGAAFSSPSKSIDHSNNTPYSCIFSLKTNTPEPIAFGILISSKDSSVNIFSPQRDSATGTYAYKAENGLLYPHLLAESHIKIQDAYYIEKYDSSRHWFDPKKGSCNYRNEPPFYEYQQVKSKLTIRNIS